MDYRHIVTVGKRRSLNWDAHHPQLVPQSSNGLQAILQGNELGTENGSFHSRLSLGKPNQWGRIYKNEIAGARAPDQLVSG